MRGSNSKIALYKSLNQLAEKNSVVVFGSSIAETIPFGELWNSFGMRGHIYNRSVAGLSVMDAEEYLEECVFDLHPEKIVLLFDGAGFQSGVNDISCIIEAYKKVIRRIKDNDIKCKVIICSEIGYEKKQEDAYNEELKKMAEKLGVTFVDLRSSLEHRFPLIKVFCHLRLYLQEGLTFYDAMNYRTV